MDRDFDESLADDDYKIFRVENGHGIEMVINGEMGGGVEELMLWCHTCDPVGLDTRTFPLREYEDIRDAVHAATDAALAHSEDPPLAHEE